MTEIKLRKAHDWTISSQQVTEQHFQGPDIHLRKGDDLVAVLGTAPHKFGVVTREAWNDQREAMVTKFFVRLLPVAITSANRDERPQKALACLCRYRAQCRG